MTYKDYPTYTILAKPTVLRYINSSIYIDLLEIKYMLLLKDESTVENIVPETFVLETVRRINRIENGDIRTSVG